MSYPVAALRGHGADVQAICYDEAEEHLVSGDAQGEVRIWSLADLRPLAIRRLHPVAAGVVNLCLLRGSSGCQFLISQGRDGVTQLWGCSTDCRELSQEPIRTFSRAAYSFCRFSVLPPLVVVPGVAAAAETPEPDFVATLLAASGDALPPTEWAPDKHTGDCRQAISLVHTCDREDSAAELPAALLAIPGNTEQQAEVCCSACRQTVALISPEAAGMRFGVCMALRLFLGPDQRGVLLAAGYEDGSVAVWDVASPQSPIAHGKLHTEPVMALDMEPGGRGGVCGAAEDKLVSFLVDYDAGAICQRHAIDIRKQGVGDVAVRPDGKIVAVACWDGRVRLYKRSSGKLLAILKYHTSAAAAVAFSPCTYRLATGARDGTIALWDVYAREPPA